MASSDYYILDNSDIEDKKLEAAKNLYASGNFSGALKIYLDMVTTSYSYKLHYEIGRCYYKLNDMSNAEEYFKRSVALENIRNSSYLFLGNICYKNQDISLAIENWVKYWAFKPDDEAVCLNLATSYFSKNMRLMALFYYEKYLKYAKDKTTSYYNEIKKSVSEFKRIGTEFYQKAQRAVSMKDNETAIHALEYAIKNYPLNFDANFLLGKLYSEENKHMQAMVYFKQALCLDSKSLDVLQQLSSVLMNIGDYTGAYCCLKRIMPLVLNNQKEYLDIVKMIKQLEFNFDSMSSEGHARLAEQYYVDNNYQYALYEYENVIMMNNSKSSEYEEIIGTLKTFINPEERIIRACFEKGSFSHGNGDFRQANRYFSKIMSLAGEDSSDYRLAKSRLVNV